MNQHSVNLYYTAIYMRYRFIIVVTLLALSKAVVAQEGPDSLVWLSDVGKARAQSESTGKPIFAFFTGSDWCGLGYYPICSSAPCPRLFTN